VNDPMQEEDPGNQEAKEAGHTVSY
jgi:hypothetical protein